LLVSSVGPRSTYCQPQKELSAASAFYAPGLSYHSASVKRTLGTTAALLVGMACDGSEQPSSLAERAASPSTNAASLDAAGESFADHGQTILLQLALPEETVYRVTTVASVKLPLVPKPIVFAREERVEVHACEATTMQRSCELTHRIANFESEPNVGKILAADEDRVKNVVSKHRISANGKRLGDIVLSEADRASPSTREVLSKAHRFYCLRFPELPVAVGATWTDTCTTRTGGVLATRDVEWTFVSSTEAPDATGKRAELQFRGTYTSHERHGDRNGHIQGVLLFHAGVGEPHVLKERITVPLEPGHVIETTLNHQFAKLVASKTGEQQVLLTDGSPFPDVPAVNQPPPTHTSSKRHLQGE